MIFFICSNFPSYFDETEDYLDSIASIIKANVFYLYYNILVLLI
jgi:hypothetical protein